MFRLGLDNYLTFGNPLGTNEIMKLMFKRDLIVLGLSDGAMCAATGFGLLLQKLILAKKITWDKQGWIIQVVSCIPRLSELELTVLARFGISCSSSQL